MKKHPSRRQPTPPPPRRKEKPSLAWEHLTVRPLNIAEPEKLPMVEVKAPTWSPLLFRKRLGHVPADLRHGEMVKLIDSETNPLGYGLYNPRAEIAVRVLSRNELPQRSWWEQQIRNAIQMRHQALKLPAVTNAYRIIHAEGDFLPGLMIDRYGDVISAEIFSLGMYQRREEIVEIVLKELGLKHAVIRTGPNTVPQEGFEGEIEATPGTNPKSTIIERDTHFEVDFSTGHKTGFFLDQRENRELVAQNVAGKSLLDLCCYTGGFSIHAKKRGNADVVVGVDLDEHAIAQAKRNARINHVNVKSVHTDIFSYMRELLTKQEAFDVVVLDPPKLINNREEYDDGLKRYFDMNRLALQVVKPGGLFLTCSCSGLLSMQELQKLVSAALPQGRQLQFLEKRGAGSDHPIASNCPETEYLKALWCRVI
jgi:23S rRNA (cytosine1962-C5)-methyltransferase